MRTIRGILMSLTFYQVINIDIAAKRHKGRMKGKKIRHKAG